MVATMLAAAIPFTAFAADDIVAELWVGDSMKEQVSRADFATKFKMGDTVNNITAKEAAAGNDFTVKLLQNIDVGTANCTIYTKEGVTATFDGDPDGDGVNAKLTGSHGTMPSMHADSVEGNGGTVIFKNFDYEKTVNNLFQYFNKVDVVIENCKWNDSATNGSGICPNSSGTVTLKSGTVITAYKGVINAQWATDGNSSNHTNEFIIEEGATIRSNGTEPVVIFQKMNASVSNATITLKVDGGMVEGVIEAHTGSTVELNSGTLKGSLECDDGVVTKQGSNFEIKSPFEENQVAEIFVGSTSMGKFSNDETIAAIKNATDTITLILGNDFTISEPLELTQNLAINGKGNNIIIDNVANAFILGEGTNKVSLQINDSVITGNNVGDCVFQMKSSASTLKLTDVTFKNIAAQNYVINLMAKDGSTQTVNLTRVKATEGIDTAAFLSTGNASEHMMHAAVNILESEITHSKKIIQVNKGSTCDISLKSSLFTLAGATSGSAITIANPESLASGASVTKSTLNSRESIITVPNGCEKIAYDATNANVTVQHKDESVPTPDDIVAVIYETGKPGTILKEIKRSEFADMFPFYSNISSAQDIFSTDATLKGKNLTIEFKHNYMIPEDQRPTMAASKDTTITILGNDYFIEGGYRGWPMLQLFGPGNFVLDNVNLHHTNKGSCVQYFNGVTIDMNNCTLTTEEHNGIWPTNQGTLNLNSGTVINAKIGIIYSAKMANIININDGAVINASETAFRVRNDGEGLLLNINGGELNSDATAIFIDGTGEHQINVDGGSIVGDIVIGEELNNVVAFFLNSGSISGLFNENSPMFVFKQNGFVINGVTVSDGEEPDNTDNTDSTTTSQTNTTASPDTGNTTTTPDTGNTTTAVPDTDVVTTQKNGDATTNAPETNAPADSNTNGGCAGCSGTVITVPIALLICAAVVVVIKKK